MRIAMFLDREVELGGGFQQSFSAIESLAQKGALAHEIIVFTPSKHLQQKLSRHGINSILYKHRHIEAFLDRLSSGVTGGAIFRRLRQIGLRRIGRYMDALLDAHRVDLVLLNESPEIAWRLGDHSFILTVWDLCHREWPEFPEVYAGRTFERREAALRATLSRAVAIVANAPGGARAIIDLYKVDPKRIIELPSLPSVAVRQHAAGNGRMTLEDVRDKYGLTADYVFYPAQFWPHKNHLYLLEALAALKEQRGISLNAVFCGSDRGNLNVVERQVRALDLTPRVHFLGFVPDEDIPALYQGAVALVIPSYFGPDVLPPLEAAFLGCPAICSDLPEFRHQMGDAALYCDLSTPVSLTDKLALLVSNPSVKKSLQLAGQGLAADIAKVDYARRLSPYLDRYEELSRRWINPQT